MFKGLCALIILIAIVAPVAADAELRPWSWGTYTGTLEWTVTVTETGCDSSFTNQFTVPIKFANGTAVMGDVGHGEATGEFVSGNILHIPGRTVADPPGSSQLSAYDLFFTTDCAAFAGKYSWDYSGPDGSCNGETTLNGVNSNGCPAPMLVPVIPTVAPASGTYLASDIAAANQDLSTLNDLRYTQIGADINPRFAKLANLLGQGDGLSSDERRSRIAELSQKTENELKAILVKDPYNFDANYDMAQLKKSQHKEDEYRQYLNTAMGKAAEKKVDDLSMNIAQQNGFATMPTQSGSGALSQAASEIRSVIRNVYGQDFSKMYSDSKKAAKAYLYASLCEKTCDFLTKAVNEAASTGGGGSP